MQVGAQAPLQFKSPTAHAGLHSITAFPAGRKISLMLNLEAIYIPNFPFSFQSVRELLMVHRNGELKTKDHPLQRGTERS